MLQSVAKLAVTLNVDRMANSVVERFYGNAPGTDRRLLRRFQIVGYHKVSLDIHPFFEPVHPEIFEQQMRFLKSCYKVMSLRELMERSRLGDVPARSVAITFDDGYRDNYEYAFPILKKYGLPATVFVATGAVGTGNLIWHDRIFDAFRYTTVTESRLIDPEVPPLLLESDESRHRSLHVVLARAKSLYGEARLRFVDDVEHKLKPNLPSPLEQRMLNWDQVREMHKAGIEFGSHTVSHTILSRLPRPELFRELRDSRSALREQLSAPIFSFAYPNGKPTDYNDEAKAVLKECGYSCAVTCQLGFNHAFSDPYELRRGQPWQKEIEVFRFKFFLQRHGLAL
jgi:peptidoglycan/xylan/chitin deacetylase (PgdA/CDA1 family)